MIHTTAHRQWSDEKETLKWNYDCKGFIWDGCEPVRKGCPPTGRTVEVLSPDPEMIVHDWKNKMLLQRWEHWMNVTEWLKKGADGAAKKEVFM